MTRSNRYGYIANLCVSKPARRQGVATNMLHFAIKQAKLDGKMKMKHFIRNCFPGYESPSDLSFLMSQN